MFYQMIKYCPICGNECRVIAESSNLKESTTSIWCEKCVRELVIVEPVVFQGMKGFIETAEKLPCFNKVTANFKFYCFKDD